MSGDADTAPLDGVIGLQAAAELIWLEADLLDARDYRAWLALWSPSGLYVIPVAHDDDGDPADRLNVVYDDAAMRVARVKRLESGFAMSASPGARTVRTVSRFRSLGERDGVLELRGAQHIVEYKFERTRTLAADVTYRIRRGPNGLILDGKIVRLINSDEALFGIGYLL